MNRSLDITYPLSRVAPSMGYEKQAKTLCLAIICRHLLLALRGPLQRTEHLAIYFGTIMSLLLRWSGKT